MPYIDIHSHRSNQNISVRILNIFAQDLPSIDQKHLFSVGLHPWHIGKTNEDDCLMKIEESCSDQNMLAIGECGLDKSISANFAVQKQYFLKQVRLAEEHRKPLIIHCVKSYSEILYLKKNSKTTIPWILHAYQANIETSLQLIRHDFYFSVGGDLLLNQKKHEILRMLPIDRLFFETDDSDVSIENMYILAAQILMTDLATLMKQIETNFSEIFGNGKMAAENRTFDR